MQDKAKIVDLAIRRTLTNDNFRKKMKKYGAAYKDLVEMAAERKMEVDRLACVLECCTFDIQALELFNALEYFWHAPSEESKEQTIQSIAEKLRAMEPNNEARFIINLVYKYAFRNQHSYRTLDKFMYLQHSVFEELDKELELHEEGGGGR